MIKCNCLLELIVNMVGEGEREVRIWTLRIQLDAFFEAFYSIFIVF